jgi:hypothetical protein
MGGGASIVPLGDDRLNTLEELFVDDGRVFALVVLAVPQEIPRVEGVFQQFRDRAPGAPGTRSGRRSVTTT